MRIIMEGGFPPCGEFAKLDTTNSCLSELNFLLELAASTSTTMILDRSISVKPKKRQEKSVNDFEKKRKMLDYLIHPKRWNRPTIHAMRNKRSSRIGERVR